MKGYLYTLEVVVAAFIIFTAIVYTFRSTPIQKDVSVFMIKSRCYNALKYLDDSGILREYVRRSYEEELEESLSEILPQNLEEEVVICKTDCGYSSLPTDRSVIIVDYYISGYKSTYDFNKVRVYVWESY